MNRKVRHSINALLAGVAFAMGVAVIYMAVFGADVETTTKINLLGIAIIALGILAVNKEEKNKKTE